MVVLVVLVVATVVVMTVVVMIVVVVVVGGMGAGTRPSLSLTSHVVDVKYPADTPFVQPM